MLILVQWGKNIDNTFCVYELNLLLARMKCVCAIRLSVFSFNMYYCCTLYNKQHNFLKSLTECEVFTSNFSINTFENIIILRRIERHVIHYVYWYSFIVPLIFEYREETLKFLKDFRRIIKYQISWRYFQWEQFWFMERTDGQMDRERMTKFIASYRNHSTALVKE